jgi:uncharacterized protein YjbJ (UPF0337 family)
MEWNFIERNWNQLKGRIQDEWDELTDEDLVKIAGKREQLASKLAERYSMNEAVAEWEIDDWMYEVECRMSAPNEINDWLNGRH